MVIGKLDIRNGDKCEVKLTTKELMQFAKTVWAVVVILDELRLEVVRPT